MNYYLWRRSRHEWNQAFWRLVAWNWTLGEKLTLVQEAKAMD